MDATSLRTFALVPASALAAIERAAEESLHRWCEAWGAAPEHFGVEALGLDEAHLPAPADEWHALHGARSWKSSALAESVCTACGLPQPAAGATSISAACTDEALLDLQARLTALLRDPRTLSGPAATIAWPAPQRAKGHGLVLVNVKHGLPLLSLVAPATSFKAHGPAKADADGPLKAADLDLALRAQHASLEVVLGHAELSLADMMDLGPGDVLLLDRHIHEPLQLAGADGRVSLPVHLGRQGEHFAVQLGASQHS